MPKSLAQLRGPLARAVSGATAMKEGYPVSKYLEMKAQIEAMTAQLETTRREELDEVVKRMKHEITAFGITAEMLGFPGPYKRPKPVEGARRKPGRPPNAARNAATNAAGTGLAPPPGGGA